MLAYLAGIPKRLAYCRENPYQLLTDWVPDQEPYMLIKHQVRRDLDLVATIGASTMDDRMRLHTDEEFKIRVLKNLSELGIATDKRWLILHPGVSEPKRAYPIEKWVASGQELINNGYQLVLSGIESEKQLCHDIQQQLGASCWNAAGLFSLVEFVQFISLCPLVVSVNTGTVHIAAAVGTPVVVLYAMTNPQHTPWKVPNRVLPFPVSSEAQSRNEVICHVQQLVNVPYELPGPEAIVCAVQQLLEPATSLNPEPVTIVWPQHVPDQDPARPAS
jgi:ADP-heptose:LPS heptosyltransferase